MNRRQALLSLAALAASPVVPVEKPNPMAALVAGWKRKIAAAKRGHMLWSSVPRNYIVGRAIENATPNADGTYSVLVDLSLR